MRLTQFALENGEKTIIIGGFTRWPWSDHRDPTMVPATRLAGRAHEEATKQGSWPMTHIKQILTCLALVLNPWYPMALLADEQHVNYVFNRMQLSDQFYSEGATYADLNRDGSADVISGPYWYAGPDFTERFEIYDPKPFDIKGYSLNFLMFAHDINRDGWQDVLVIGHPGKEVHWFENPRGGSKLWSKHLIFDVVDNESPTLSDLTGDGRPELVFHTAGQLGYAEIPQDDPRQPWQFRAISADQGYTRYNHGLGVGDVNGDGRADLLEKNGWWEQPTAASTEENWQFHPVEFSKAGGAQMFAYDLDGDGDNDVVTSKAAQSYGLAWFEIVAAGESIAFREHTIMGDLPEQNEYGVVFSQLHALAMTDMDGDGVKDIVTGKRFWAHGGRDPGGRDPAVLYWFQTVRDDGRVRFIPHRIDLNSGVGTQVVAGDVNGDDRPDIVVGNKKGAFLFLQRAPSVDQQTGQSQ